MAPIIGIMASQISGHLWTPTSAYDSIATTTVGSGGSSTITFSSIPSTYTHLQIRGIGRRTDAQSYYDNCSFYFNTDSTTTNYYRHLIEGDGATVSAASANAYPCIILPGNSLTANAFGEFVVDILDYTNINKYKTIRSLTGLDVNGAGGGIRFTSGLWKNTAAINTITFIGNTSYSQYSSFALYGIK